MLKEAASHEDIVEVYLHVQTSNEDAIRFYTQRGFRETGIIQNYYRRITPPHAVVLSKVLRPSPTEA